MSINSFIITNPPISHAICSANPIMITKKITEKIIITIGSFLNHLQTFLKPKKKPSPQKMVKINPNTYTSRKAG